MATQTLAASNGKYINATSRTLLESRFSSASNISRFQMFMPKEAARLSRTRTSIRPVSHHARRSPRVLLQKPNALCQKRRTSSRRLTLLEFSSYGSRSTMISLRSSFEDFPVASVIQVPPPDAVFIDLLTDFVTNLAPDLT